MLYLIILLALTPIVYALNLPLPVNGTSDMRIVWRYEALSQGNVVSMNVYTVDWSAQFIQSDICTTMSPSSKYVINKDGFKKYPIALTVQPDNYGGTLSFNGRMYTLSDTVATQSGLICRRAYNERSAIVDCILRTQLPDAHFEEFPINLNSGDCVPSFGFDNQFSVAQVWLGSGSAETQNITKRGDKIPGTHGEEPQCEIIHVTEESPQLDVSTDALHRQLSETNTCAQRGTCSVGITDTVTWGWTFTATTTLAQWISAGLSVVNSYAAAKAYTCTGTAGDTVCIWRNTMYKGYNVQNCWVTVCFGIVQSRVCSDNIRVDSPVINNAGGGYYCVLNTCRTEGQEYWQYNV